LVFALRLKSKSNLNILPEETHWSTHQRLGRGQCVSGSYQNYQNVTVSNKLTVGGSGEECVVDDIESVDVQRTVPPYSAQCTRNSLIMSLQKSDTPKARSSTVTSQYQ
jgi:hypothetical protein